MTRKERAIEKFKTLKGKKYRHKKRGIDCVVLCYANMQLSTTTRDEDLVVVYKDDSGMTWVRPFAEFMDGRFEEVQS